MKTTQKMSQDCPHCEAEIEGITGTGCWICPECGGEIHVNCACPKCSQEVEIRKWGRYSCPSVRCATEFDAASCIYLSAGLPGIDCPDCGVRVEGVTGTGDWMCSTCDTLILVQSFCPSCGQEVEVDQWGVYSCPGEACEIEFETAANVFISTEHAPVRTKKTCRAERKRVPARAKCIKCGINLIVQESPKRPPSWVDKLFLPKPPLVRVGKKVAAKQVEMPLLRCPVCGWTIRAFPWSNMK